MDNKFVFTVPRLNQLSAKEKRYFVYDARQPGLRLYVTPSGTKTFQFQFRSKQLHRIVTRTLGKFPALNIEQARNQAAQLLVSVNDGVDIEAKKRESRKKFLAEPTVKEFATEYIERYAKINKKSWKDDQRTLNTDIIPIIGSVKMSEIKKKTRDSGD